MQSPIICFDLDGTLLDSQGRIHPDDVALLASSNPPALFIPSTGRPVESVRRALARNNLYVGRSIPLPLILLNGSLLLAEHESPIMYHPLDPSVQNELIVVFMQFQHVTFWLLSSTDIFVQWPNPLSDRMAIGFDFTLRPLSDCNGSPRFSKIMCVSDSPSALSELAQAVAAFQVEAALSLPTVLELTPQHVDKGSGVTKLLQHLEMVGRPFFAAGDGENDLPLFRLAARSFAPATAPESIKAGASQVVDVSREGLLRPILRITG